MEIITRIDAAKRGLKRYYTGKPCKHGHDSERWVYNGHCVECTMEFRLMTMKGFTWIKCGSRQPDKLVMGMGHMTRANSEDCLFAVKGKLPTRINAGIVQSFTAPRLEHSRKPDVVREKLVQLLGDVSRIELFARQSSHGFDVWGNQCEDPAVQLHPGYALDIGGLTNAFSNAPLSPTDNQGRERAA